MRKLSILFLILFNCHYSYSQCVDCEKDSLAIIYSNHQDMKGFAEDLAKLQPNPSMNAGELLVAKRHRKTLMNILLYFEYKKSNPSASLTSFTAPVYSPLYNISIHFKNDKLEVDFLPTPTGSNQHFEYSLAELKLLADFIEKEKSTGGALWLTRSSLTTLATDLNIVSLVAKGNEEASFSSSFNSLNLSEFGGSAWQQQVIFGLTDFLLERAKKEINASFIEAFKDVLKKDPEVEKFFKEVFPKTMKIINNFGDYDVKNILPEFKKAIEIDYQAFPYTFPEYTASVLSKYSEQNGNKVLNYVSASMYVLSDFNKAIIEGVNPVEGLMCGISDLKKEELKDSVLLGRLKLIKSIYCFRNVYIDELMQVDQKKYFEGDFKSHVLPEDTLLAHFNIDSLANWSVENREMFNQYWSKNRKNAFLSASKGLWTKKLLNLFEKERLIQEYIMNQVAVNSSKKNEVTDLLVNLLSDFNSIWDVYDQHKITINSLKDALQLQTEIAKVNLYKDSINQEKMNLTINILPHGINMLETIVHFAIDQLDDQLDETKQEYWKKITTVSTDGVRDMVVPLLQKDYSGMVVNGIDLLSDLTEAITSKDQVTKDQSLESAVANSRIATGIDAGFYEAQLNHIKNEINNSLNVDSSYFANNFTSKLKKELKEKARNLKWEIAQIRKSDFGIAYLKDMTAIDALLSSGSGSYTSTNPYNSGVSRSVSNVMSTSAISVLNSSPTKGEVDYLFSIHPDSLFARIDSIADVLGVSFGEKKVKKNNSMVVLSKVGKLLSFTSNIATAKDYEQVQVALNNFMDPVGGFKHKRLKKEGRFYASLNSYIGWNFNYMDFSKVGSERVDNGFSMSPSLNLGIEAGWTITNGFNIGIYGSVIELGALASFRMQGNDFDSLTYTQGQDTINVNIGSNSTHNITFEQIFAPSVALTFGVTKKFPIAFQVGYRFSPNVWRYSFKSSQLDYQSKYNAHQFFFSVCFDLTLYRFTRRGL